MLLRALISVLFAAIVASLVTGFYFFVRDRGRGPALLTSLKVRVALAVVLLALVVYGLTTGQLVLMSPWQPA